ncbi:MAG: ferredoxin:thioredoxin reductase [Candidatus Aenigmatarchaeota archaeon]|nr:MAG: ferredoxin:thioredoxin reductase [Candidatus Aenigmarchaeota archaeon]
MDKSMSEVIKDCEEHAKRSGYSLNPNKKFLEAIARGLSMNEYHHGKRYCPCRPITGNREEDEKNVCPCVYHKEEIEKDGKCHCSLFFRGV